MNKLAPGLAAVFLLGVASAAGASTRPRAAIATAQCSARLTAAMPRRRANAPGGRAFARRIANVSRATREALLRAQLLRGNIPGFLRHLQPVVMGGGAGRPQIVICVSPDYAAIGSNRDFLRIPMGLSTAMAVTSRLGFVLPTRKMVNAIYAQARVKLPPRPMPAGPKMVSTAYFQRHNATIEAQLRKRGAPHGALTAGDKKDLVLTEKLWRAPGHVAIYGWQRLSGKAIQPLTTVHVARYADYSHGVRLVSNVVTVDGRRRSIYDVLADPRLAPILSDEGTMPRAAALVAARGGAANMAAVARRVARRFGPARQVRAATRSPVFSGAVVRPVTTAPVMADAGARARQRPKPRSPGVALAALAGADASDAAVAMSGVVLTKQRPEPRARVVAMLAGHAASGPVPPLAALAPVRPKPRSSGVALAALAGAGVPAKAKAADLRPMPRGIALLLALLGGRSANSGTSAPLTSLRPMPRPVQLAVLPTLAHGVRVSTRNVLADTACVPGLACPDTPYPSTD